MSLLISTVLSGSRNRLAPLVDAPWTMPGMAERCSDCTTRTYRPFRSVTTWSCRYLDVSLPRRYDSRVLRSRERCFRSRSRISLRSALAPSTTLPDGSIFSRMLDDSPLNDAAPPMAASRIGNDPFARRMMPRASLNRIEERREREQPERFERASLDRQRDEDLRQVAWRPEREIPVRVEESRRFARRRQQLRHAMRIGGRREPRELVRAHGRQRKAA